MDCQEHSKKSYAHPSPPQRTAMKRREREAKDMTLRGNRDVQWNTFLKDDGINVAEIKRLIVYYADIEG